MRHNRARWAAVAVLASVMIGTVAESEAGTRFTNRKSRADIVRGSSETKKQRKGLFSKLASRNRERAASRRSSDRVRVQPRTVTQVAEAPKKKRRGFLFARNRERSEERSRTSGRRSRTAKQQTPRTPIAKINHGVLASSNPTSNRVVVDISKQRAYLLVNGKVAVESPISSARAGKYTPRGTFYMTQRVPVGKVSTIYHVEMPYWMRLNHTVFGMHAGYLPGYPASAGCVRLSSDGAAAIYEHTRAGTRVNIYSSWSGG